MDDILHQYWNSRDAESFDSGSSRSGRMAAITRVVELAKPHIHQEGAKSIDLGCGTGIFAKTVGSRHIIGVDCSSAFLALARTRMDVVWQRDILNLELEKDSFDNVVSLFVIDDYVADTKSLFLSRVFTFLKPCGHFFFCAYSPNDERMGRFRDRNPLPFDVHLEPSSFYENVMRHCGYVLEQVEIIRTDGTYDRGSEVIEVKREFIVITAHKPLHKSVANKNLEVGHPLKF